MPANIPSTAHFEQAQGNVPGLGAFQYHECKGSPQESYSSQTFIIKRVFDTPWRDRWKFCVAALGDARRVSVTGVTDETGQVYGIKRSIPDQYGMIFRALPLGFNPPQPVAISVESIEGLGSMYIDTEQESGFLQTAGYEIARITLRYEAATYPILYDDNLAFRQLVNPDRTINAYYDNFGVFGINEATLYRHVSRMTQPTAEALTLPNGAFKFVDGFVSPSGATGSIVPNTNVKIVPTTEVHYTWHQVPGKPLAINSLIGTVNKYYFDSYAAGTLLLVAVEVKSYRWITGRRLAEITYKMKHFSAIDPATNLPYTPNKGHNYFLHPGSLTVPTGYYLITKEGVDSVNRVYREKDYNLLFNPNDSLSPNVSDDNLE